MPPKTANHRGNAAVRALALALVLALHCGLLWLILNSASTYPIARSVSTLVRLIEPEPVKPKFGAALKSPVITRSEFALPKIEPPKVVVEIVKPTPAAPPAPAPPAAASGASAPDLGVRAPPPPPPPPDDFTAYKKMIHDRLQNTLDEIASEQFIPGSGAVSLQMEIDRSGAILICEVADAHPPAWLLRVLTLMVRRNDPLPPFPTNTRAKRLGIAVPVTLDENLPGE